MDTQQQYERARKRVRQIKGFYAHLTAYVLVNALLVVISFASGEPWSIWPLLGWGIGIVAHALNVFGVGRIFGDAWEERQIRKLMDQGE
jgi:hypothetical protein